ncbi:hypothetical protein CARUB_v10028311mg [Capsella rubella]|uniref:RING-type domain-containing protein n=1 Tax=Capsella rubella TaxID=81985 RepID=R0GE33_9BRAS|nr:uncharacterized protein LOC17876522 [Capsella rubella]EOA14964.1 hypothetical protein CARUB_v10028311mg [Capsella rubella]
MMASYSNELLSTATTVSDRIINRCFIRKKTTKERIYLKATQVVESDSCSMVVTYEPRLHIRHGNLDGHEIKTTFERHTDRILEIEDSIPKRYLVSQDTCVEHVMIILSRLNLSPLLQERVVRYIAVESVNFNNRRGGRRGGLLLEVLVTVEEEQWVRIDCSCDMKGTCLVPPLDCSICLTKLSSVPSRMQLPCSHLFHRECVMTWLEKNPSCPICRTNALGETVSIF